MAGLPSHEALAAALPETGEISYTDFATKLTLEGKGKFLAEFHEARRAGVIHASFREGVLVVSRFPIAREARRIGLSANQGGQG